MGRYLYWSLIFIVDCKSTYGLLRFMGHSVPSPDNQRCGRILGCMIQRVIIITGH